MAHSLPGRGLFEIRNGRSGDLSGGLHDGIIAGVKAPAIAMAGIGPGAGNMLSGIITAYAEGSPVITLSSQRRRNTIYPDRGGSLQIVDLLDLHRPVTKWSAAFAAGVVCLS